MALDFFDDGVWLNSTAPGTAQYATQAWPLRVRNDQDLSEEEEVILRFTQPLNEIAAFAVPFVSLTASDNATGGPTSQAEIPLQLDATLIRVSLSSGTYALSGLTWTNANRDTGTLFATAANYETMNPLWEFEASGWGSWTPPPAVIEHSAALSLSGVRWKIEKHFTDTALQPDGPKISGPYYGIHLRFGDIPGGSVALSTPETRRAQLTAATARQRGYAIRPGLML